MLSRRQLSNRREQFVFIRIIKLDICILKRQEKSQRAFCAGLVLEWIKDVGFVDYSVLSISLPTAH